MLLQLWHLSVLRQGPHCWARREAAVMSTSLSLSLHHAVDAQPQKQSVLRRFPWIASSPFVSGCLPPSMVPKTSSLGHCCWKPCSPPSFHIPCYLLLLHSVSDVKVLRNMLTVSSFLLMFSRDIHQLGKLGTNTLYGISGLNQAPTQSPHIQVYVPNPVT